MDKITVVIESIVTLALDENGWSLLQPVLDDGSLGQQVDSTDVAEMVAEYLLIAFQ